MQYEQEPSAARVVGTGVPSVPSGILRATNEQDHAKRAPPSSSLQSARRTLEIEARAVAAVSARLDETFAAAVQLVLSCKGRTVVSGMGKSGHVARKIASTLASTGTPAFFVHPAEASHGDLGMITAQDVLIALSNSGESAELLAIVPFIKREGARLIAITGNRRLYVGARSGRPSGCWRRGGSVSARPGAHGKHHCGSRARRRAGGRIARSARLRSRRFCAFASRRRARPSPAHLRARCHARRRRDAGGGTQRQLLAGDPGDVAQRHGNDGRRR